MHHLLSIQYSLWQTSQWNASRQRVLLPTAALISLGIFLSRDQEKTTKIFVALFVCFSTKEIHLELVSSLTKEDCILALQRFIARRGLPSKILSDNGISFIGARNDLIKLKLLLDKNDPEKSLIKFLNQKL